MKQRLINFRAEGTAAMQVHTRARDAAPPPPAPPRPAAPSPDPPAPPPAAHDRAAGAGAATAASLERATAAAAKAASDLQSNSEKIVARGASGLTPAALRSLSEAAGVERTAETGVARAADDVAALGAAVRDEAATLTQIRGNFGRFVSQQGGADWFAEPLANFGAGADAATAAKKAAAGAARAARTAARDGATDDAWAKAGAALSDASDAQSAPTSLRPHAGEGAQGGGRALPRDGRHPGARLAAARGGGRARAAAGAVGGVVGGGSRRAQGASRFSAPPRSSRSRRRRGGRRGGGRRRGGGGAGDADGAGGGAGRRADGRGADGPPVAALAIAAGVVATVAVGGRALTTLTAPADDDEASDLADLLDADAARADVDDAEEEILAELRVSDEVADFKTSWSTSVAETDAPKTPARQPKEKTFAEADEEVEA